MAKSRSIIVAFNCLFFASLAHAADPMRLKVSRDTWVSNVGKEADGNNGGAARLKTKGIQEFALLDLDFKPLVGHLIESATLHVHVASQEIQRRATISTIASDWTEGTATGYTPQKGSASFRWAKQDEQPWSFPGSDIVSVINGAGNTLWRFADATPPDKDGWQTIAVDPSVVAARVAGISHGFVLFDDVGSEYERNGEQFKFNHMLNRLVSSREEGKNRAPYFTINVGPEDHDAPDDVANISSDTANLPAGEASIHWLTPKDHGPAGVIGFLGRYSEAPDADWDKATPLPQYLMPMAGGAGEKVTLHLRDLRQKAGATVTLLVRSVDRAGNLSAASKSIIKTSAQPAMIELKPPMVKPYAAIAPNPIVAGVEIAIIDALDKVQPVTGQLIPHHDPAYLQANHLWSAADKTVRLFAARNEFVDFQILLKGKTAGTTATLKFDDENIKPELLRFRHVQSKSGPLPDPLLPLDAPLTLPATDEKIEGQQYASLIADLYIPHTLKAGQHTGTLTLVTGGESLTVKIDLHIWDFTLPDHLSFLPEMNCYGLPDSPDDLAYYRLAQAHRTCLNRLGYSWRGDPNPNCVPKWDGKTFTWTDYDKHYGPLLDGSAFADLPRKNVPIESLYLNLNENWPLDVNKSFKGGYWADEAFEPTYIKRFSEACGQFASHFKDKKWTSTFFEFYLNNKVYYKDKSWSRCSAPWILDEPVNTQDFWALRFYGKAFHEGVDPVRGDVKMAYRCDISRPEWQRDTLDNILDVYVVGGSFRDYHRMVMDRTNATGMLTINYGGSNNIETSNIQPAAWCIDTWTLGGNGVLPWQTVGETKSWDKADELSLFYPGKPVNSKTPVPSIRLKSFRRGEQDIEYLTILAATLHEPRLALANTVRQALKLSAKLNKTSETDAGQLSFDQLDPGALWRLRVQVAEMLDGLKPPAKEQWIEFTTPGRDVSRLPAMGLVAPGPKN